MPTAQQYLHDATSSFSGKISIGGPVVVDAKEYHWTGSELGALPYESDFSLNQRFAFANKLTATGVLRTLHKVRTEISFSLQAHAASAHSSSRFGSAECQNEAFPTSALFSRYLFSDRLRECPICADAGYHSYLYQIKLLKKCPIHDCALVSNCMYCGTAMLTDRDWRRSFDTPYRCIGCGWPRGGAKITLRQCSELRGQAALLRFRLQPVFEWAQQVSKCDFLVNYAERTCRDEIHEEHWQRQLVVSAAMRWAPPPPFLYPVHFDVSILKWKVRTLPLRGNTDWRFREADEAARSLAAWALAQRRMHQWRRLVEYSVGNAADTQSLKRSLMELWGGALRVNQRHADVVSSPPPPLPFERESGGVPRVAAFAYYLGVQALTAWQAAGKWRGSMQARCPLHAVIENNGIQRGWVFFPTVPGLDLRPLADLPLH